MLESVFFRQVSTFVLFFDRALSVLLAYCSHVDAY